MPPCVPLAQSPLWMALGPGGKVALDELVPPGLGVTVAGCHCEWV